MGTERLRKRLSKNKEFAKMYHEKKPLMDFLKDITDLMCAHGINTDKQNEVLAALKSILDVRDFERKRKHERD